mmetsp:Transcript_78789/g.109452  ORF Transcript_78789/g.109452 Transcript_78789/m.109452 type:complete len:128 (-) Transcript_78789:104-487(-)
MGGTGEYPTYENYTAGNNYSETLRLEYDTSKTSYKDLLAAYWQYAPDPSEPCDDPAYCLRIFTVTSEQWLEAQESIMSFANASGSQPIISVYNASDYNFWKAEEYHQHYFEKSGQTCNTKKALLSRH